MKDFMLSNDTKLMFRNDPAEALQELVKDKKVLFVYGGGSALKNGCCDDVRNAVRAGGETLFELGNAVLTGNIFIKCSFLLQARAGKVGSARGYYSFP